MKGDAVIRVPRPSWLLARDFAERVDRDLRELTGIALEEYVAREAASAASAAKRGKKR
jgi:hypothetical protein